MRIISFIFLLLIITTAEAALVTKEIPYTDNNVKLNGYLVYNDSITPENPAPGVLVIHEWWGLNDYARHRANMLAELGYVAFAIDMYGVGILAKTPEEAKKLSKPFLDDRNLMRRRAMAGLNILESLPFVDKTKIGVIGYCFGGTAALELARSGANMKGVVSFHGGLSTSLPAVAGKVKAKVLALNGADDPTVSATDRQTFEKEMKDADVNFKSIDYPGALHAFTNPDSTAIGKKYKLPIAYNETADKKSWKEMENFFTELFRK